ncbi:hypothetical protein OE88DRAFT_1658941 [Heliocybe sulcata]|uniref:Dystroglycan-type cadherin-like domain-containing protein n=1 Tax=Heliocybe sulcata TaxID=5364 RepID=A0A5C3N4S2_9AGAM|nr:hypothetical protein OE88DRAFT_1658941 [Heliocybe sulcata]
MIMLVVLYIFLAFSLTAHAAVSVSIPLDEQLPAIARVGKPYTWSFSPKTFFSSKNASIALTGDSLPDWLSLDPGSRTFQGTPGPDDAGNPEVHVKAAEDGTGDTVTSKFTLCITSESPPVVKNPVEAQFHPTNPSLSSVFLPSQGSALSSTRPALRIPEGWSFSIGFVYNTFDYDGDLYYAGRQLDGSPLPPWLRFNAKAITFDGVTPSSPKNSTQLVSLALHGSDQEGYSAGYQPFDLYISSYELSLATSSLPTINITASTPFSVDFSSPADFTGVTIDGNPIQPADLMKLAIDVTEYSSWLHYDEKTRTLSGQPPDPYSAAPVLPVELSTFFNQTLYTNVSLAVVPSFFSTSSLPSLIVQPGKPLTFDLVQYFSNETTVGILGNDNVDLSASFDPPDVDSFLGFDADKAELTGTVPKDVLDADYDQISVMFTAYSHVTHSTSHTSLNVTWAPDAYNKQHARPTPGLSNAAHAKLLLALEILFGVIGGIVMLGVILAGLRHCTKVPDTALTGEAGYRGFSEKEKQWYGIDVEEGSEEGYGWTERKHFDVVNAAAAAPIGIVLPDQTRTPSAPVTGGRYGSLGRTVQQAMSRLGSSPAASSIISPNWSPRSNVISKGEFLSKIRATVRQVSDKYLKGWESGNADGRPMISKPTLITAPPGVVQMNGLPSVHEPFDKANIGIVGYIRNSVMSLGRSPSSSTNATGERSIPRRRADFVPPGRENTGIRAPAKARRQPSGKAVRPLHRQSDSMGSVTSYEAEAVVQTATKAMSIRSARSVSGISYYSQPEGSPAVPARPRLVPFTSAARVPVPSLPYLSPTPTTTKTVKSVTVHSPKRVASQRADVLVSPGDSGDDLEIGMQYVKALGEESSVRESVGTGGARSVFSLESSEQGHRDAVPRMLLRCGEHFRFVIPVVASCAGGKIVARLRDGSGRGAPAFLRYVLKANGMGRGKEAVEFWGAPGVDDLGEFAVGLYVGSGQGECVGRVDVEIVRRS